MPKNMKSLRFVLNRNLELILSFICSGCNQELELSTGIKPLDEQKVQFTIVDKWGHGN